MNGSINHVASIDVSCKKDHSPFFMRPEPGSEKTLALLRENSLPGQSAHLSRGELHKIRMRHVRHVVVSAQYRLRRCQRRSVVSIDDYQPDGRIVKTEPCSAKLPANKLAASCAPLRTVLPLRIAHGPCAGTWHKPI